MLRTFLEDLPEPETSDEIAACCYSDMLDDFSTALFEYRIKSGKSQKQLADQLKMQQPMISKYESGEKNLSLKTLCDILAAIGKRVSLSIEDVDENPSREFNMSYNDDTPDNFEYAA